VLRVEQDLQLLRVRVDPAGGVDARGNGVADAANLDRVLRRLFLRADWRGRSGGWRRVR
jgi:hypothetical protein